MPVAQKGGKKGMQFPLLFKTGIGRVQNPGISKKGVEVKHMAMLIFFFFFWVGVLM